MKLSHFDYAYPKELVAQYPLPARDASRMMVVDRSSSSFSHQSVASFPEFLRAGDLLVVNDSKVAPARLFGKRENGEAIEILVVEPSVILSEAKNLLKAEQGILRFAQNDTVWRCLAKKARSIKEGERFSFGANAFGIARGRDDLFLLVDFPGNNLDRAMKERGVPPLPPYIGREGREAYTAEDRERYQTIYAEKTGSAAAPTAGLHLSKALLTKIQERGVQIAKVTLHVGIDTFRPVQCEDTAEHQMHGERYEISEGSAQAIVLAKREGRRVIAVGTTSVRALESGWNGDGFDALSGTTRLFITPGYQFKAVDALLTNFHQPKSTLIMLVSAFAGRDLIMRCYREAIRERYRLFSYGDCMLIV